MSYGTYLGSTGFAQTGDVSPPPVGYAEAVQNISGLISYWRCSNTGSLIDIVGSRNGTFDFTPTLTNPLVSGTTDQALILNGQRAEIPHDAGLELSTVTLSFWIRVNSYPSTGEPNTWPFAKDSSGLSDGHFGVGLSDSGELFARYQTASSQLGGVATAITQDDVVNIIIVSDSNGLTLYKNGQFIGTDSGYTSGWSVNTEVIRIGLAEFSSDYANMVIDEILIYNKVLSEAERLIVANIDTTSIPVAPDRGVIEVNESTNTDIDLLDGATYVGDSPTVTITDKSSVTTAGHDVTVNASGVATFAATSVSSDDVGLTFDYTIQDSLNTSPAGTVTVTVLNTPVSPSDPLLQEYNPGSLSTENESSIGAMVSAANNAPAGRRVLLAAGTYSGGTHTFTASNGTSGSPVVIEPANGYGSVTINNATWTLSGTNYFVIRGFYFNNVRINVDGAARYTRIMGNRLRQIGQKSIRLLNCRYNRIDHNDVAEYLNGSRNGFVDYDQPSLVNLLNRDTLIDYNYIHDINPSSVPNGSSIIGIEGGTNVSQREPGLTVDSNLFNNISLPGEGELFGAKFSGWTVSRNTFTNLTSSIYINAARFGGYWNIESNWFEGNRTRLMNIMGRGIVFAGNRIIGNNKVCVAPGTYDWPPELSGNRPRARDCIIVGNLVDQNNSVEIGRDIFGSSNLNEQAINTVVWDNTSNAGGSAYIEVNSPINTTVSNPSIATTPATKLSTSLVGPGAIVL